MRYKERKDGKYVFSFAGSDGCIMNKKKPFNDKIDSIGRESELNAENVTIKNIPQNDTFLFSVNERDDMKGFNVDMRNIKVCCNTATVIEGCPRWLRWLLSKTLKVW